MSLPIRRSEVSTTLMLLGAALAAASAGPAAAADDPAADKTAFDAIDQAAKNPDVFKFDFGVPSSPALTVLGVDKTKVTQSNSLKPFVVALPSLVQGKQSGQAAALDVIPAAYLVPEENRKYTDYHGARALMFRTRTAIALYNGVSDADASKQKASRAAFGFSTSFLDSSDPLLAAFPGGHDSAWTLCLKQAAPVIREALVLRGGSVDQEKLHRQIDAMGDDIAALKADRDRAGMSEAGKAALQGQIDKLTADRQALDDQLQKARGKDDKAEQDAFAKTEAAKLVPICMKVAGMAANLGQDLDFGVGTVWTGTPGKIEKFQHPGTVAWASFRRAFGAPAPAADSMAAYKAWYDHMDQWFMAGVSTRLGYHEMVATGDKTTPQVQANTYSIWLGLERYTKDSRFALEVGDEKTDPTETTGQAFKGTRGRYLITYDRKLTDGGLWVTASYGEAEGAGALKSDKTAKVTFTFTAPDPPKILGGP